MLYKAFIFLSSIGKHLVSTMRTYTVPISIKYYVVYTFKGISQIPPQKKKTYHHCLLLYLSWRLSRSRVQDVGEEVVNAAVVDVHGGVDAHVELAESGRCLLCVRQDLLLVPKLLDLAR